MDNKTLAELNQMHELINKQSACLRHLNGALKSFDTGDNYKHVKDVLVVLKDYIQHIPVSTMKESIELLYSGVEAEHNKLKEKFEEI